jgi:hypothetical protein
LDCDFFDWTKENQNNRTLLRVFKHNPDANASTGSQSLSSIHSCHLDTPGQSGPEQHTSEQDSFMATAVSSSASTTERCDNVRGPGNSRGNSPGNSPGNTGSDTHGLGDIVVEPHMELTPREVSTHTPTPKPKPKPSTSSRLADWYYVKSSGPRRLEAVEAVKAVTSRRVITS